MYTYICSCGCRIFLIVFNMKYLRYILKGTVQARKKNFIIRSIPMKTCTHMKN